MKTLICDIQKGLERGSQEEKHEL